MNALQLIWQSTTTAFITIALSGCLHSSENRTDHSETQESEKMSQKSPHTPLQELTGSSGLTWSLMKIDRSEGEEIIISSTSNADQEQGKKRPLFTLSIGHPDSEGRANASGKIGCNQWHGEATVDDQTLTIEKIATTRMRCHYPSKQLSDISRQYMNTLHQSNAYRIVKNRLHIHTTTEHKDEMWVFDKNE